MGLPVLSSAFARSRPFGLVNGCVECVSFQTMLVLTSFADVKPALLYLSAGTYDAVHIRVEAADVMGGVTTGSHCCTPEWLQTFLIPHVGSPRPTAV